MRLSSRFAHSRRTHEDTKHPSLSRNRFTIFIGRQRELLTALPNLGLFAGLLLCDNATRPRVVVLLISARQTQQGLQRKTYAFTRYSKST